MNASVRNVPWVVVFGLAWLLFGAIPPASASHHAADSDPTTLVSPAEWAALALAPCRAEAERWRQDDLALAALLADGTVTREGAAFLRREEAARVTARRNAIRGGLARLGTLMFGVDPKIAVGGRRPEPVTKVLDGLLAGLHVCAIEAVEATIVIGLFDVPFNSEMAGNLTPERQFRVVESRIREQLAAGVTLEQIFLTMRPPAGAPFVDFLDALIEAAMPAPAAGAAASDRAPAQRRRAFLEYLNYAVEPIRIQFYLHGRVDALEGAFGIALPDGVDQMLFAMARARLYSSMARLRALRERPPAEVLGEVTPILDEWFRLTALPAIGRELSRDPHAAYWFFVATGGVVEAGRASSHSNVVVSEPAFVLRDLRGLTVEAAVARLDGLRLPAAFQKAHADVEAAFTGLTLSRDELSERLERRAVPAAVAARLRAVIAREDKARVSSLDVFTLLIRDAHLVRARLDRQVVRAGIDLFYAAKSDQVSGHVQRLLEALPAPDPRLAAYLRTSATMMLELERRQAIDSAFRLGTGGGAVGWLRGRYSVGTSVPVNLAAPGGVTGPAFADLIDALTPKNRESGNDYRGRAVSGIDLVHDGREYHEALLTVVDSARHFLNISAFDWKTDRGGKDIAYRLMAKKLGIDGASYTSFLATFADGLPIEPSRDEIVAFYDIPSTRMKQLLV